MTARLSALEYIRGVAMLGVIGIHIGSQYLTNPTPNIHLAALFEVATRFSVPIFFFISAFGLFYGKDGSPAGKPADWKNFYLRRGKSVLIPYLAWSFFYIFHYTVLYRDPMLLNLKAIVKYLLFGFASYQLYFIVILLWFYLLLPLFVPFIKKLTIGRLFFLLLAQIAFNYWSCSILTPSSFANPYIRFLLENRLNYWIFHYFFIFCLGAFLAIHWERAEIWLGSHLAKLAVFFAVALAALLAHYYYLVYWRHYKPEWAINVAQQLSPCGVVYTFAASLFLLALFLHLDKFNAVLATLGKHSYFAYLFHPVLITYINLILAKLNIVVTAPVAIIYYCVVAGGSIAVATLFRTIGSKYPLLNQLTIGSAK